MQLCKYIVVTIVSINNSKLLKSDFIWKLQFLQKITKLKYLLYKYILNNYIYFLKIHVQEILTFPKSICNKMWITYLVMHIDTGYKNNKNFYFFLKNIFVRRRKFIYKQVMLISKVFMVFFVLIKLILKLDTND